MALSVKEWSQGAAKQAMTLRKSQNLISTLCCYGASKLPAAAGELCKRTTGAGLERSKKIWLMESPAIKKKLRLKKRQKRHANN
jgi:hypothetical protein